MSRRDWFIALGVLLLLAVAVFRIVRLDRPPLRRISVEGLELPETTVETGETKEQRAYWEPPEDVYVIGWEPWIGAAGASAELMLLVGETRVLTFSDSGLLGQRFDLPDATGYLVRKPEKVTLLYRITNTGPTGPSLGARALIYFVPVEGN